MIDYFERVLRFTNLEIWDIHIEKVIYRVFIFDEHRPPTQKDFHTGGYLPILEEDLRANFVSVSVYSENLVRDQHIELLSDFSKQATNHLALAHCDVVVNFYTGPIDDALETLLKDKLGIAYEKIPLNKLWHLNQD